MGKFWVTRNGKRLRLTDMTDAHLINASRLMGKYVDMLNKEEEEYIDALNVSLGTGDVGCPVVYDYPPIYYDMIDELEYRGIIKAGGECNG